VQYLGQAAENAAQRHAPHEVIALINTALTLLATLPDTPARAQQELPLQLALAVALSAVKGQGAPEVVHTYARAQLLCTQLGETPQLFPTLLGACLCHRNRGALLTAREVGEQLVQLAQRTTRPADRLTAHNALGFTTFLLGDYGAAQRHCAQGIALLDPPTQRDQAVRYGYAPGVFCLSTSANTLWCLGCPAQAVQRSQEALALARALEHPRSLAFAHLQAIYLQQRRREVRATQAQAEALLTLATAQGFPQYVGYGTFWRGWALTQQGQQAAGLAQMHQGLDALVAMESLVARPLCLIWLAEATVQAGDVDAGLRLLAEALEACASSGRGDALAEAHRLKGEMLLQAGGQPHVEEAAACFQEALSIARRQQAKAWELRAAMSLARLWQQQGKRDEARSLLAQVYGWFTEGLDTADLQEARALLAALQG
jgi:predicted ATPase